MDISLFTVVYFAVTFLLIILTIKRRTSVKAIWPKGPPGLPLFGHLFHFGPDALVTLRKHHEKYGKTIHLKMGIQDIIVCGDGDLVKKYFSRDTFSSRPEYSFMNAFVPVGIIHFNHEKFRVVKRFTMKALRSIGFGSSTIEPLVHEEIDYFIQQIDEKRKQGTVKITLLTGPAASNVVSSIVVGQRFDYEDETRKKLDALLIRALEQTPPLNYLGPINFIESFKHLAKVPIPSLRYIFAFQNFIRDYIESRVKIVEANFNSETDEPHNFIECFLKESNELRENVDFDQQYLTKEILIQNCYAFFVAGSATTQEYLEWWFLIMGQYPEIQENMYNEINRVIGKEKVTFAHRNEMPYTEAVLSEVHRWSSLVSLNLPHCVDKDTEFGDYFLPKGTQLIINIYEIHRDPKIFEDPETFKPERFLSPQGKYTRLDKLMPFGYGKRSCPGESLAQMEIFLFTVTTLQNFKIKLPSKWDGKTYVDAFTRVTTQPVEIIAEKRE